MTLIPHPLSTGQQNILNPHNQEPLEVHTVVLALYTQLFHPGRFAAGFPASQMMSMHWNFIEISAKDFTLD